MKGDSPQLNVLDVMRRRLTITGSTLRSRDVKFKSELATEVEKNVWPLLEEGRFKPFIYKTFALEKAGEAHRLMETSEHIGKIILVCE